MQDRGVTRERATQLELTGGRRRSQAGKVSQEKMAAARPDLLAKDPRHSRLLSGGPGLLAVGLERPDGTRLLLQWRQGQVTVGRVSLDVAADAALISAPLARELDAHVYAEDGTRYAECRALARRAKALILASATRHNGNAGQFPPG